MDRIEYLKNKILNKPRYASIEQARIITQTYKKYNELSKSKKRALSLYESLKNIEISVEKEELIVGNRSKDVRAGIVFPESGSDWVNNEFESLPTRKQDTFNVREEDIKEFREEIYPFWHHQSLEDVIKDHYGDTISKISKVVKINQKDHAQGHICPDVEMWLKKGPKGLLEDVEKHLENCDDNKREFYECSKIVLEGSIIFMQRYHDYMIEHHMNNGVAKICLNLSKRPPITFHEALQSLWFLFVILQMESNASSFSPGRADQYLFSYYKNDSLTEEEALELIECLYLKFNEIVYMRNKNSAKYFAGFPIGFNIAIGGINKDGHDCTNELSYLFLKAQEDLGLPQPNLSVRLHKNSPSKFLQKAIKVVSLGSGMPQFFNDEAIIDSMQKELDISLEDARDYAIVGCVELTTQGNNLGWSDAAMFNLNKALELTLTHGVCLLENRQIGPDFGGLDTYKNYEELEEAYKKMINYYMEEMIKAEIVVEKAHQDILPTAFLSMVINSCLEKGLDVTKGGAKYNLSGVQMIQVANVADSLAAIKKLVFEEKRITAKEMLESLKDNYQGHEITRALVLNKAPKYGNDIDYVDEIGVKWATYFRNELIKYKNYRGGKYHTGMYTVSAHVPMGENVGASPDGRLKEEPLADGGLSPVYGRDLQGPTAVLKSVSKLPNYCTTNGGLLNMKFLPEFFDSQEGRDKFELFLRAFTTLKIPHIQFNVVNKEDLLDAKVHPERHQSLTIRVAGYTAYFVELAGNLQDEIIERTAYDNI